MNNNKPPIPSEPKPVAHDFKRGGFNREEHNDTMENFEKILTTDFEFIEKGLKKLGTKDITTRRKILQNLKNSIMRDENYLKTYILELERQEPKVKAYYHYKYDQRCKQLDGLKIRITSEFKNDNNNDFYHDNNKHELNPFDVTQKNTQKMDNTDLMDYGDGLLDDMEKRVAGIQPVVVQARDMMVDINEELNRQKVVMAQTIEDAQESQSLLKRSKKMINYLKRNMMTDKIIMCVLVLLIIALVVIVILGIMGKGGGNIDQNLVPPYNNYD